MDKRKGLNVAVRVKKFRPRMEKNCLHATTDQYPTRKDVLYSILICKVCWSDVTIKKKERFIIAWQHFFFIL